MSLASPHTCTRARGRFFILSFGMQYPRATTKAWLHATVLHWCLVNFLFKPLKIGVFAVALPKLISGKLRRLRYPKHTVGAFQFRTPMRDSAVDYLAAQNAHLPIAKFLLRRQGHATGAVPPPNVPLLGELLELGKQREASVWCWRTVGGRARADLAALFSPIRPQRPLPLNHAGRPTRVAPM
jgi:hypothetical protein